jgi:hypothetical protein
MAEYPESLFPEITEHKKKAFLASYAHTGRVTHAAKAAQVNWRNHYLWLKADPVYAEAFATAKQMVGDWLEEEAIRRAKEGIVRPIYYQGAQVAEHLEYSDTLLIFLLKGAKPEKYRERLEHVGKDGMPLVGNVTITVRYAEPGTGAPLPARAATPVRVLRIPAPHRETADAE